MSIRSSLIDLPYYWLWFSIRKPATLRIPPRQDLLLILFAHRRHTTKVFRHGGSCLRSFALMLVFTFFAIPVFARFDVFSANYDTLTTLAGTGKEGGKGVNRWDVSFEGKPAIQAELSRPHFVMADPEGNLFIADKDAHGIRMISSDGNIVTVAGTSISGDNGDGPGPESQLASPNGLYVTPGGTCYILDLGNGKIRKLTNDGQLVTLFKDPGGIAIGRGLWVSDDESVIFYASNTQVKKWTPDEGISTYASGFVSLGNLTVDPDGFLVVTDRSGNRVYRIGDDGSKTVIAGNGNESGGGSGLPALETGLYGVRGVWFFEDGSYLLATHSGSQVWWVDPTGLIHLFLDGKEGDEFHTGDGEHFQTPGYKISEARSVSVDYAGNILIAENDVGYIRKVQRKKSQTRVIRDGSQIKQDLIVYPNPFNGKTRICYSLQIQTPITLDIFDVSGRLVRRLVDQNQRPGSYEVPWDARNQNGESVVTGLYTYRLQMGSGSKSGKLLLVR